MTDPVDPLAEIQASFFVECDELLESLTDGLQSMEDGSADDETINVVFRAVHSIKGGAGAFGLSDLVDFSHVYETALDMVRSGDLDVDPATCGLFFSAADILSDLVASARDGSASVPAKVEDVKDALNELSGAEDGAPDEEIEFQPMAISLDLDPPNSDATPIFDIHFAPHIDLYHAGNEPLFLFRALEKLGALEVIARTNDVPKLSAWDEDETHLSWDLTLTADCDVDAIHEVFEFVADLGNLTVDARTAPSDLPSLPEPSMADNLGLPPLADIAPAPVADPEEIAGGGGELSSEPTTTLSEAVQGGGRPQDAARPDTAPKSKNETVRVDLQKIDELMNLVGELVINQAMLSQSITKAGLGANSEIGQCLEDFMLLTRNIQDNVMTVRAQPVKPLFQRMGRIVREASTAVGKSVRLNTIGEMTEVDKTVIERLSDPLTHMIRNAIDHGLESSADREAQGKSREGTVTLSAAHQSGRVLIEVSDDGGGIDRPSILRKAKEKGLIGNDVALNDGEIDNLLFMPGFSTAGEVSSLSGRGVGMDVVKTAIHSLGGRISIDTKIGQGTKFSVSLPLTLAVLDGMVVRVCDQTLVMPLGSIVETMILDAQNLKEVKPGQHVVDIRGGFAPLIDLGVALGYRPPLADYRNEIVLVVGFEDGSRSCVVIDSIQEQRQVVIKGLQNNFEHPDGIAAATILGDGRIALILDPAEFGGRNLRASVQNTGNTAFKNAS